jgi:hypothetical protein
MQASIRAAAVALSTFGFASGVFAEERPGENASPVERVARLSDIPLPALDRETSQLKAGDRLGGSVHLSRTFDPSLDCALPAGENYRLWLADDVIQARVSNRGYHVVAGAPYLLTDTREPLSWIVSVEGSKRVDDVRAALYTDLFVLKGRMTREFSSLMASCDDGFLSVEARRGERVRFAGGAETSFGRLDARWEPDGRFGGSWIFERSDARFELRVDRDVSRGVRLTGLVQTELFESWIDYQVREKSLRAGVRYDCDDVVFSCLGQASLQYPRSYGVAVEMCIPLGSGK